MKKLILPLFALLILLNVSTTYAYLEPSTNQPINIIDSTTDFSMVTTNGQYDYEVTMTYTPQGKDGIFIYYDTNEIRSIKIELWSPAFGSFPDMIVETLYSGVDDVTLENALLTDTSLYPLQYYDVSAYNFKWVEITFYSNYQPDTTLQYLSNVKLDLYVNDNNVYWLSDTLKAIQDAYDRGVTDTIDSGVLVIDDNNDGYDDTSYINGINSISTSIASACTDLADHNDDGYEDCSYTNGYNVGVTYGMSSNIDASWFTSMIDIAGSIFTKEIFPGTTIGMLASIPIAFALFAWFMKLGGK